MFRHRGWLDLLATVAIFSIGMGIRLYHLGTHSLDIDEMVSTGLATRADWGGMWADTNPPLFMIILRFWLSWLPHSEFWIRWPSFVASCLSMFLMFKLVSGEEKKSDRQLYSLAVLAVSPLSVQMAQWARGNSLWELSTIVCLYGALRAKNILLGLGIVSGALTHWFSWPLSLGIFLESSAAKKLRAGRKWVFLTLLVLFSAAAAFQVQKSSFHLDWQMMRFRSGSFWDDFFSTMDSLFGSRYVLLIFLVCLSRDFIKTKKICLISAEAWIFLVCTLFGLSLMALSFSTERSLFLGRYLNPIVPLISWSLPILVIRLKIPQLLKHFFFGFWLLSCCYGLYGYMNRPVPLWRHGLKAVVIQNPKFLWTTRSIEIADPYLEGSSVEIRQFQGQPSDVFLIADSARQGRTAIIDNFWGGLLYWQDLKAKLIDLGYKVSDQEINGNTLEPLRLMIIENSAPSALE